MNNRHNSNPNREWQLYLLDREQNPDIYPPQRLDESQEQWRNRLYEDYEEWLERRDS